MINNSDARAFAVHAPGDITVWLIFVPFVSFRHGILGSINGGTGACPDGARWWPRGDHHLFLSALPCVSPCAEEQSQQQNRASRTRDYRDVVDE